MTIDPTVYAATIIATTVATMLAHRLLDWMRHGDKLISLERANAAIQAENTTAQQHILQLEKNVHDVTERLLKHESREAIIAKYEFEQSTGLYRLGDLHVCPRCLLSPPHIEAPMYDRGDAWLCQLCPHFHSKES